MAPKAGRIAASARLHRKEREAHRSVEEFPIFVSAESGAIEIPKITRADFQLYEGPAPADVPVVISVDTGLRQGASNSPSVVQAWCQCGSSHYLIDQWTGRVFYDGLRSVCRTFRRRYRPSAILIERTGGGEALIRDIPKGSLDVIGIEPVASKRERLLECVDAILGHRIFLPYQGYMA